MAETPSDQSPTQMESGSDPESLQYWCYSCDKRVSVETLADLPDVVCYECKNGFVESISAAAILTPDAPRAASDSIDDPIFGNQFIQVLRLIAQAAREEDAPPPPPSDPSVEDYLRIELDGWDNEDDEDDERSVEHLEDEDVRNRAHDTDDERSVEHLEDEDVRNRARDTENRDGSEGEDEEEENEAIGARDGEYDEEVMRRRRRDVLRLRLRDFATRAASRRNRILDWAEILMGLEDHSIELRFQVPESDTYIGNPGDYVDAVGYEALLQNLAESDSGGRRGAPPAAKAAVEGLGSLVIDKEGETLVCAICKDLVNVGEIAKKLPCGHGYHGECIIPWLGSRNSCPVCRFELPTDDPEYEEERKKRLVVAGLRATSSGSSGGGSHESGFD